MSKRKDCLCFRCWLVCSIFKLTLESKVKNTINFLLQYTLQSWLRHPQTNTCQELCVCLSSLLSWNFLIKLIAVWWISSIKNMVFSAPVPFIITRLSAPSPAINIKIECSILVFVPRDILYPRALPHLQLTIIVSPWIIFKIIWWPRGGNINAQSFQKIE